MSTKNALTKHSGRVCFIQKRKDLINLPEPTTLTLAIKAAVAVATDERTRKIVGGIIIAILSPFILAIALICAILGGGTEHNSQAVFYAFNGDEIPSEVPLEYRKHLENMRDCFEKLDEEIAAKNEELDNASLNSERIKALFYSLHFGKDGIEFDDEYYKDFVNCFVEEETIDEETVIFPIENIGKIHDNLTELIGRNLTTEEKTNAENIYNRLLFGDNILIDDYNFNGSWSSGLIDTDIQYLGDGAETKVVYFHQADERWGSQLYGNRETIAASGCGPTTLAMVVSTLTDRYINPSEMANWAYQNGFWFESGGGSYHSIIPDGARHFGLSCEGATRYEGQKIADALSQGRLVVALMGPGNFTTGGHFILLRGITSDGQVLVADPFSIRLSEQTWNLSLIVDESSKKAGAGGPFWIF